MGTSFCLNRQAYVKLIIFSSWQWKKNSRNWFCHSLEANQSLTVDGLVSILCADGQPLFDSIEARDNWKRKFAGFLANFSLERGEGGCFPAFVIDNLFQGRPKIFDQPKESNPRRVGFFGKKLDLLLQEGKGDIFHVGLWANGVRDRWDRVRGRWDKGQTQLASAHMANNTLDILQ